MEMYIITSVMEDFFDNVMNVEVIKWLINNNKNKLIIYACVHVKDSFYGIRRTDGENEWLNKYNGLVFYRFFRMKPTTFTTLLEVLIANDVHLLIKKKYRGGNFPVSPEKSLMIFLWYIAQQDTLQCIGHQFKVTASTVMKIVNIFLYVTLDIKKQYIFWPRSNEEYEVINDGFANYPGAIGAIDGSHIDIQVPTRQHDSYIDRYQKHSINLMSICTATKMFTYIFVGFPGSAHDARVFSNSLFVQNINRYGPIYYLPNPDYHLIGDSAFPIRTWLMTPYKQFEHFGRIERYHNFCLSRDRVVVENIFGLVKGRWRRLIFINTYSVSKAIEITTAACVLHNFCYHNHDEWDNVYEEDQPRQHDYMENDQMQAQLGRQKRNILARNLFVNR